jgi:hypothetical protein
MSTRRETYEVTDRCGGWIAGRRVGRLPIGANGRPIVELTKSEAEHELRTGLIVPYIERQDTTPATEERRPLFAETQPADDDEAPLAPVESIPATPAAMAEITPELEAQAIELPKLKLRGRAAKRRARAKG